MVNASPYFLNAKEYKEAQGLETHEPDRRAIDMSAYQEEDEIKEEGNEEEQDESSNETSNKLENEEDLIKEEGQELELGDIKEDDDTEEGLNESQELEAVSQGMETHSDEIDWVMATDEDFSGTKNGEFKYIGNDEYVEIPHVIKGVNVTSYRHMFFDGGQGVKGVKSTNKKVTDMSYMFRDFKGNSTLDISNINTENVKYMQGMFMAYTYKTTTIEKIKGLDKIDTGKVETFHQMFYRNGNLKELDVSNFDTSSATNMYGMFDRVWGLPELDVSNFDTRNVVNMREMFQEVNVLKIDLRSFNTEKVTSMERMFYATNTPELLGLDTLNTENVTSMRGMFHSSIFQELKVENFNTKKVKTMREMFKDTKVGELDLRKWDLRELRELDSMFEGSNVRELSMQGTIIPRAITLNSTFNGVKVETLDLGGLGTTNVTDMIYMFKDSNIETIKISDKFTTSNVEKMSGMFENSSVKEFDFSNFDTRNVVDMDRMFRNSNLKEIDLTSFNTDRITDMKGMFEGSKATSIKMPNFETTYVVDMSDMFKNTQVKELDLSSFNLQSVNDMENMFLNTKATVGKARSLEDTRKLNTTKGLPSKLTFTSLYKQATDKDFSGQLNGEFRYIGESEYIELPEYLKEIKLNTYNNMFEGTSIKGVISEHNITNMEEMFKNHNGSMLDVKGLNTGKLENASGMFENTTVNELDLSNFNTENLKDASKMFKKTQVGTLDLGSFDLSKIQNTEYMFESTKAKVGYGRTERDVEKLNKTSNKPKDLSFKVWGINTEQNTYDWTNKEVDLEIQALSEEHGIDYVEMVNEEGRNYLIGSENFDKFSNGDNSLWKYEKGEDKEGKYIYGEGVKTGAYNISTYVSGGYYNLRGEVYSEDLYPLPEYKTYSLDVKSDYPIQIRLGEGKLYTTKKEWSRIKTTVKNNNIRPLGIIVPPQTSVPLGTKIYYRRFKIEKGDKATPWKPAPEDSESSTGQEDVFKIYNNGTYVFRAIDTKGNTKTVTHKVSNIDTTQPTAKITQSTDGWTSNDISLTVNAEDDLSGVESITLPDGEEVKSDEAEYEVTENGTYKFKVRDKAGNESEYEHKVTNIDKNIPELKAKLENTDWTRDTVDIKVTSEKTDSGIKGIIMKNSPLEGRNLILGSDVEFTDKSPLEDESRQDKRLIKLESLIEGDEEKYIGKDVVSSLDIEVEGWNKGRVGYEISMRHGGGVQWNGNWYGEHGSGRWYGHGKQGDKFKGRIEKKSTLVNEGTVKFNAQGLYNQMNKEAKFKIGRPKLELGTEATPWTPAPEDIKLEGLTKIYPVSVNGRYVFEAEYNNGVKSETSINVTNIDREPPKVTVNNNPTDWTEEDEVDLEVTLTDEKSGLDYVTLPNGEKEQLTGNKQTITYPVSSNGEYKFKAYDKLGNEVTETVEVSYMMVPFSFIARDKDNKPVEGAVYELLRDGNNFRVSEPSNKDGLVDFGKVPPTWKYTVRLVSTPGGSHNGGEIEVSPGEDDDSVPEITVHERGDTLPATGTYGNILLAIIVIVTVSGILIVRKVRRGGKE